MALCFLLFSRRDHESEGDDDFGRLGTDFLGCLACFCRLYQEGRDDDDLNGRQDLWPIQAVESCHSRVVKLVGSGVGYRVWVLGCFMGDERVSETCLLSFGSVRPSTGVATANAQRLAQYCHRRVTPCFQTSKTSKAVVAMIYYMIKEFSQLSLLPDECTEGKLGKVAGRRVGKSRLAWYDTMPMRITPGGPGH